MTKHYVISADEYMGSGQKMHAFVGTWHELLHHLLGINDGNRYDEWIEEDEEGEESEGRTLNDLTDKELEKWFTESNGDGEPYRMVWCVEENMQVLG